MKTLDMQFIRYLNLFERITGIRTRSCFPYNNMIIFAIKKNQISKAIGEQGRNVRKMSETIKKRIKIVSLPLDEGDAARFIADIVSPVTFKNLEINDEIVMNAGSQNKAALIGRNKVRLKEMQSVAKEYFNKDFRII